MEKETEEMAFPGNVEYKTTFIGELSGKEITTNAWKYQSGMTLRDYFAAHGPWTISDVIALYGEEATSYTSDYLNDKVAEFNADYADVMIKEHNK